MSFYDNEDNSYAFDYNHILSDTDELYNHDDYEDDYREESEYEHYYHNVMEELDNE